VRTEKVENLLPEQVSRWQRERVAQVHWVKVWLERALHKPVRKPYRRPDQRLGENAVGERVHNLS
jgi:hypothetical protein